MAFFCSMNFGFAQEIQESSRRGEVVVHGMAVSPCRGIRPNGWVI